MANQQNLVSDLVELVRHVSNTPVFERKTRGVVSAAGNKKRLERRKQKTEELVRRIKSRIIQG